MFLKKNELLNSNTSNCCSMKLQALFSVLLFYICFYSVFAQQYASKIVDAQTQAPIPYATLQYGNELGTITNEEGEFRFVIDRTVKRLDSVYISCMGYGKTALSYTTLLNNTINLEPKSTELIGVELLGKGLTAEKIVERMKLKAPENYQILPVQKRFFLRQSTSDVIERAELKLVSSSINKIHQFLLDSITKALP